MIKQICLAVLGIGLAIPLARGDDLPVSPAQKYLESGDLAQGEVDLTLRLDANPADDESRFGLGAIQFIGAIEKLGKTLYEYGVDSKQLVAPFPRLPIPKNEQPATINQAELRRVAEVFVADLNRAEETLSKITSPDVKLKLLLAKVTFDFTKSAQPRVNLSDILKGMNGSRPTLQNANPDIRIHFDRGDVAWLRAYCHVFQAMAEGFLSAEPPPSNQWLKQIFPNVEPDSDKQQVAIKSIRIGDAPRLLRFRLHVVAVCELNRETWAHIRKETDDDFEWLSHPQQKDQLGLPLRNDQIDGWLNAINEIEKLFRGESLLPRDLAILIDKKLPDGQTLNIRKVLDDPPRDFLNVDRIDENGIDPKYLEAEASKPAINVSNLIRLLQLFSGPFGVAQAARLN